MDHDTDTPQDDALKAGARHSKQDMADIQAVHDAAVRLGARCDRPMPYEAAKAGDLIIEECDAAQASIKALGDRTLEIRVAYGRDAHGEFFSPNTDFDTEHFGAPPLLYYHGFDENGRPQGRPVVTGRTIARENREDGHYLTAKLYQNQYADRQWEAALKGTAVASPATAGHLRRKAADGELLYWPIVEISAWDYAENRKQANARSIARPVLKALYAEAGTELPPAFDDTPEALLEGATQSSEQADVAPVLPPSSSIKEHPRMTPEEIQALVDSAIKSREDQAKAEAERKAALEAQIAEAVKAERLKWEAEAAKSRRLPDMVAAGQAPAVTAFADTRRYDHMGVDDLAFLAGTLDAAKRWRSSLAGVSNSALKALAIKIAEDKGALGEAARTDLKAAGLDPQDVTSIKANELNYSTQAGFGDEWVGVEYSRRLWNAIRAGTFVLQRLPSVEVPQGVESITIPLEGADPTWYKVGQTTDTNATTKRPDASVTASKLATANKSLTVGKVGARAIFAGELDEDSLIPWASQLRQQLEQSGAEQMEHLIIDGDTAAGATTNINHIGGTPGSSDLYTTFDGFRKLALVTNTANSRSASGGLVDTDFLETLKLMGTAGLNAADRNRVEFIIDANLYWKIMTLVTVKTRDVFQNATLENGALTAIWGYRINPSYFMHFASSARKANTAGKVDQTTTSNNTTGSILAVRYDQWLVGYKRRLRIEMERLLDSDSVQIVAFARMGMVARDGEASAITYNCGV